MSKLQDKLALLPDKPGCYLMKNSHQEIIYVGKAKVLRSRVRSYFSGSHDSKTQRLVMEIEDFEYIVTQSALEALILECNLIKKYSPRYNVMLRDDKSYPYIKLTKETHPRLEVTRSVVKDGSKYFGPYPHAGAAQQTKKLLDRLFPLRKCRNLPKRVCLYYHLKQCVAPCEFEVTNEHYEEMSKKIVRFLNGGISDVVKELQNKMEHAAEKLQFERAKEYRDLLRDVHTLMEKQNIVFSDFVDRDIFGYAVNKGWMCVQVFFVRKGKLLERNVSVFPHYRDPQEDFLSYIAQFYFNSPVFPKEVLVPLEVDKVLLTSLLQEVKVIIPQKGLKKNLVQMATENAEIALDEKFKLQERDEEKTTHAIHQLAEALGIGIPHRIEAFDNSNIQGTDPVSAMVVYVDGKPYKKEYRKYRIRTVDSPDDYETMREVIRRRYTRLLKENISMPDLILVDGGKGHVSTAVDVLENELGLFIPIAGMVKDQKHKTARLIAGEFLQEVPLERNSQAFYLLQRIQEEVHRFAIQFHRQTRSKSTLESVLDKIPGVGEKTRQRLYRHFGSLQNMKEADVEEYKRAGIGEKLAELIRKSL